ncbi:MAG: bifunctional DNA primase/polymerase, partial [Methanocellales archaeon]|nr:bifunctional DNA primase/polymerase [Methanocellales archaeon]
MTDYRQKLRDAIELYQSLGFSVIPLKFRSKEPLVPWKAYQEKHMSDLEIEQYFFNGDVNVGIVCGKISNLMVLDFDNMEAYHKGFPTWQELEKNTIVVASSPNKRHVYARIDREFPSTKRLDLNVEAHSDGTY